HAIVADPGFDGKANKRVYFGNDGGIFKTDNVQTAGNDAQYSANWTRLNNGYAVTQFYAGAGNPKSQMIIGGAQDNGTLRGTPSNQSWTGFMSGDGGWCAADQTDPNYFYGEYVYLNIFRSGNGAQSGEYICGLYWNGSQWAWKPAPYQIPDAAASHALFIAPFVLDPNNSNRILAGGASLWRTGNARQANTTTTGPSWAAIKDPIISGSYISALAVASGNSDVVWVGYANGEVWKTTNATATTPSWNQLSLMVGRYCANITIDPADSNTVYVTYGGYVQGNIHKTTSGGTAWTNIGQSLTVAAPVRALAIHPKVRDNIYAGTEVGLFVSSDGGITWGTSNQEPTNCSVDDLFWLDQTLVCVTHGRGMWSVALTAATAGADLTPQMA
ncbi:MAG: hypothetical protein K2Q10_02690, partial [Rhodospirillales bacterium]|nr:hypothetical protein [Rhodospirillales bacterium]